MAGTVGWGCLFLLPLGRPLALGAGDCISCRWAMVVDVVPDGSVDACAEEVLLEATPDAEAVAEGKAVACISPSSCTQSIC